MAKLPVAGNWRPISATSASLLHVWDSSLHAILGKWRFGLRACASGNAIHHEGCSRLPWLSLLYTLQISYTNHQFCTSDDRSHRMSSRSIVSALEPYPEANPRHGMCARFGFGIGVRACDEEESACLYRLGVGVGNFSVWDLNVAMMAIMMQTIAAVCIDACKIFRWDLHWSWSWLLLEIWSQALDITHSRVWWWSSPNWGCLFFSINHDQIIAFPCHVIVRHHPNDNPTYFPSLWSQKWYEITDLFKLWVGGCE